MKTKVVFRAFTDGDIIAIFPDENVNAYGELLSYMHNGQHGAADRRIVRKTTKATEKQYKPLFDELTAIGYDLQVVSRLNRL